MYFSKKKTKKCVCLAGKSWKFFPHLFILFLLISDLLNLTEILYIILSLLHTRAHAKQKLNKQTKYKNWKIFLMKRKKYKREYFAMTLKVKYAVWFDQWKIIKKNSNYSICHETIKCVKRKCFFRQSKWNNFQWWNIFFFICRCLFEV